MSETDAERLVPADRVPSACGRTALAAPHVGGRTHDARTDPAAGAGAAR